MEVEVTYGEHEIIFTADGYYALRVFVRVDTGGIECISAEYGEFDEATKEFTKVGDASCNACATRENGVCISGFSITGYLKEKVAPPVTTICEWIESIGLTNLTLHHALYIYYKSKGWDSLAERQRQAAGNPPEISAEQATLSNAVGVYYYYKRWISLGNRKTGCAFASLGTLTIAKRLTRELESLQKTKLIERILKDLGGG
jgi:hypothetical protein